jgi:hypothetical protein
MATTYGFTAAVVGAQSNTCARRAKDVSGGRKGGGLGQLPHRPADSRTHVCGQLALAILNLHAAAGEAAAEEEQLEERVAIARVV